MENVNNQTIICRQRQHVENVRHDLVTCVTTHNRPGYIIPEERAVLRKS